MKDSLPLLLEIRSERLFHRALLHVATEEWSEAEELLQRVVQDTPGHATATELLEKLKVRRDAEQNRLIPPQQEKEDAAAYGPGDANGLAPRAKQERQ